MDTFVIDEADRLFDMGFYPDLKKMFRFLPPREERQTMLFSATLEMRVRELAWEYMNEPAEVEFESQTMTVDSIKQELYHVAKSEKLKLLLQLLEVEQPKSALIFTNSRYMTMNLAKLLKINGWDADYISGDLSQFAREKALEKMKNGKIRILVATDVAARGLQIDNLPLVVNYDVPEDYENYVHRIGRTARAGKSGKAITLADEEFVYGLEAIEKYINMKIPVIWPDNLPEIEVKTRIPREPADRKPVAKKPANKSAKKPVAKSTDRPADKPAPKKKPLGKMTEEERMKYYRQKYGFEPKAETVKKPAETPVKTPVEASVEKKGFFKRLASLFRSKKGEN